MLFPLLRQHETKLKDAVNTHTPLIMNRNIHEKVEYDPIQNQIHIVLKESREYYLKILDTYVVTGDIPYNLSNLHR
jgi:hypothetical protein